MKTLSLIIINLIINLYYLQYVFCRYKKDLNKEKICFIFFLYRSFCQPCSQSLLCVIILSQGQKRKFCFEQKKNGQNREFFKFLKFTKQKFFFFFFYRENNFVYMQYF